MYHHVSSNYSTESWLLCKTSDRLLCKQQESSVLFATGARFVAKLLSGFKTSADEFFLTL